MRPPVKMGGEQERQQSVRERESLDCASSVNGAILCGHYWTHSAGLHRSVADRDACSFWLRAVRRSVQASQGEDAMANVCAGFYLGPVASKDDVDEAVGTNRLVPMSPFFVVVFLSLSFRTGAQSPRSSLAQKRIVREQQPRTWRYHQPDAMLSSSARLVISFSSRNRCLADALPHPRLHSGALKVSRRPLRSDA